MKMKYVMTNRGPIIFPETIEHRMLRGIHNARDNIRITSAGFVDGIVFDAAKCHGASESLRMKSDPDDTQKVIDFCVLDELPWRRGHAALSDNTEEGVDDADNHSA